jgi:hypothetical protein
MTDPTNPATPEDVVLERPLTPQEDAAVPRWLDQAWTILQGRVRGLSARMNLPPDQAAAVSTATVRQVIGAMVERKVRNPDGLRSFTVDDVVHTVDAALSSGQLEPTVGELALLAVPVPSGGMYSIQLCR